MLSIYVQVKGQMSLFPFPFPAVQPCEPKSERRPRGEGIDLEWPCVIHLPLSSLVTSAHSLDLCIGAKIASGALEGLTPEQEQPSRAELLKTMDSQPYP